MGQTEAGKLDVQFFKPFIDGTRHTLKVQCSIEIKHGKPFFKAQAPQSMTIDIAGVLGLTSPAFRGSVSLCFPKAVFLDVMSKMLGDTFTDITDEMADGAAELLNIIFGQAKRVLNEQGYALEKAIPTVIRGTNIQTRQLSEAPTVILPFSTDAGEFYIEIATESGPESN